MMAKTGDRPAVDEGGPAIARDLRMATFRLGRRLRAERALDAMSDGQFAVLFTLKAHGPHTLRELADRERVTAPSMNRTVNGLEEAGWVSRTPDPTDGRKVSIRITDTGRTLVHESVRRHDAWLAQTVAGMTARQRRTLAEAAAIMSEVAAR